MTSNVALKHLSNLLFVASVVVLAVAIVISSVPLYVVAAFLFVDSFVLTSLKRRMFRQAKAGGSR